MELIKCSYGNILTTASQHQCAVYTHTHTHTHTHTEFTRFPLGISRSSQWRESLCGLFIVSYISKLASFPLFFPPVVIACLVCEK
jgi:uncharacterized PurR-regulated membrane protein YhhQ (DUF165 family)